MRRRLLPVTFMALALAAWPASGASAHPLGNFTVNRYAGIHVSPTQIRIDYVLDMAEIPTFQEMAVIDSDGDGAASPEELSAWSAATAPTIASGIELAIDGEPIALHVSGARAQLLPGQGELPTLRFEGDLFAAAPDAGELSFHDTNEPDRIGWREVTAVGQDGIALSGSTVPAYSVSDALRSYPQDLLASPLDVRSMTTDLAPGESAPEATDASTGVSTGAEASGARPGVEAGPFVGLLGNQGFALIIAGLAIAVAFGAWHALLPGHGKTLMAAYMVGSRARVRQAVSVGVAVAVMHTASVLGLGLLVLTLERTFRPETIYPWLGLVSGLVALGLGAYLLISRLAAWSAGTEIDPAHAAADLHDHGPADDARSHDHGSGRHTHTLPEGAPLSPRGLAALALAGGILPAPSALLVMLGAINAHRAGYGLALVVAFSAGLATALIVVGLGAMKAREAMTRRLSGVAGRLVPVMSAAAIVLVGGFLTLRGVAQI
jgi:nickel/cobalt exporter